MYRHRFDALSFVFGLLFVGMAFFAPVGDWFPSNTARWIIPSALVTASASARSGASASSTESGTKITEAAMMRPRWRRAKTEAMRINPSR